MAGNLRLGRLKGRNVHRSRSGYVSAKNINLRVRLALVQAITTIEDGNRARLGLNYIF